MAGKYSELSRCIPWKDRTTLHKKDDLVIGLFLRWSQNNIESARFGRLHEVFGFYLLGLYIYGMREEITTLQFWKGVDGVYVDLIAGISHGVQFGLLETRSAAPHGTVFMAGISMPRTALAVTNDFTEEQWSTIAKSADLALTAYRDSGFSTEDMKRFL